jgi:SAM-dependent methyltransferase
MGGDDMGGSDSTTASAAIDMAAVEAAAGSVIGFMTGATVIAAVNLGERLGLYRALAGAGAMSSDELAKRTGCHARLVREWIDGQTAAGVISYDEASDRYALSDAYAMVLADEDSPVFLAGGTGLLEAMYDSLEPLSEAFRGDGGLSWSKHHASLFPATARFFRPGYRANLVDSWLPALDGVSSRLAQSGGAVADVGCGFGHSSTIIAKAYPKVTVTGFDFHAGSIERAAALAAEDGLASRTSFKVASATSYEGSFDLICFFDCLHDMGDPVGIARHAASRLAPGGSVMLVEPFALDDRAENHANPPAAMYYSASTFFCAPNSLSQEVGLALGAQCGERRMRAVFTEAGFSHFRRATETPFNIVYEARL